MGSRRLSTILRNRERRCFRRGGGGTRHGVCIGKTRTGILHCRPCETGFGLWQPHGPSQSLSMKASLRHVRDILQSFEAIDS